MDKTDKNTNCRKDSGFKQIVFACIIACIFGGGGLKVQKFNKVPYSCCIIPLKLSYKKGFKFLGKSMSIFICFKNQHSQFLVKIN